MLLRLNANKLMEMGIKPGPLYGRIKRGESVRSSDGRLVSLMFRNISANFTDMT